MVGRARTQLLVEYITAVKRGVYRLPANTPAFAAHKGTTVEEVYAKGSPTVTEQAGLPGAFFVARYLHSGHDLLN